ncbi:MAG: 16S rRNA (adenine(1518)-N(6)/adenine(1519)-N(6))-dimethyltransferase RsmA [bacterium]|nr:16S rRNA (adenine(1518)-N(6)/adenine(1519)-N(6))-dimethyltransferase RsmA [bacterium]
MTRYSPQRALAKTSSLRERLLATLAQYRMFPKKSLGQNFLVSDQALDRLIAAADLSDKDLVIEIGAGLGQITRLLASKARWVIALEFDPQLVAILQKELAPFKNITLIQTDAARCLWRGIIDFFPRQEEGKIKVIGNLPYYAAVPIIIGLEEIIDQICLLIITLQKELTERIMAQPGGKAYGELSVRLQYRYWIEKIAYLPPEAFYPRPKVASEIIALRPRPTPAVYVQDEALFFRLVQAAFSQRRKTLLNALSAHQELGVSRSEWPTILAQAHIFPQRRGETLSLSEFASLTELVFPRYFALRTS